MFLSKARTIHIVVVIFNLTELTVVSNFCLFWYSPVLHYCCSKRISAKPRSMQLYQWRQLLEGVNKCQHHLVVLARYRNSPKSLTQLHALISWFKTRQVFQRLRELSRVILYNCNASWLIYHFLYGISPLVPLDVYPAHMRRALLKQGRASPGWNSWYVPVLSDPW